MSFLYVKRDCDIERITIKKPAHQNVVIAVNAANIGIKATVLPPSSL